MDNNVHQTGSNQQAQQKKSKTMLITVIIIVILLLAAALWWVFGKGTKNSNTNLTNSTPNTTTVGSQPVSMNVNNLTAKIAKDEKVSLTMTMKNTSSASITYADISNSTYGFELWQKMKDGSEWVLEAQSYQYFRDLLEPRKLQAQDFGTINPGETKEITFSLRELNVLDSAPNSYWTVLGKDSSGTFYSESNVTSHSFVCGTDIFRIEFGKVKNLHANARGLMQTDLFDDPALSNEFTIDTSATHTCQ